MKTIEYRVHFNGTINKEGRWVGVDDDPSTEIVRVQARDINSGFSKALKRALEPLGNGRRREIARLEFWAIP